MSDALSEQMIAAVRARTTIQPKVGLVLGSGLGSFSQTLSPSVRIPYRDIPGLPLSTAVGHAGELVLGSVAGIDIVVMSGRFHLYEGYTAQEVTAGIRLFAGLGVKTVILTNAAGGIHPDFAAGALVAISDHINLQGTNPLVGPKFIDMTEAYSVRLRELARATALEMGIQLFDGVYAALSGPSFETPAEIRFLRTIGADLVGMSTAMETIAANYLGLELLGLSCVTNIAAGLSTQKLSHEEVLETGRRVAHTFQALLLALIPKLA
jgi:purine-nucleoside phosphorylase